MEFELPEEEVNENLTQPGDIKMPVIRIEDLNAFQDIVAREDRVLVKFEADWCMPCKAMASVVEEIANQHPDVKVLAVDIEAEGIDSVLIEYGVRSLPTFVHLREGTKVNSTCGTVSKAELSSLLNVA
jgi:thioredoxin 1